jgi:hypothetical protein
MTCNIVIINTAVVVVRLYWFQKRFDNIVQASRQLTRSRSLTTNDLDNEERAVGGRTIRVLLSSGKPMNAKPVPPSEVPIEKLKDAKERLEAEEAVEDDDAIREFKATRRGSDHHRRSSLKSANGVNGHESLDKDIGPLDKDEENKDGTATPVHGRDIRFGDLPHPRQYERHNSDILPPNLEPDTTGLGKRTITIENPQPPTRERDASGNQPRLRRAGSMGFPKTATFERVLSQAFRRRRSGSPNSRRSSATQMTLPYFSFQPTIGRNSVSLCLRLID